MSSYGPGEAVRLISIGEGKIAMIGVDMTNCSASIFFYCNAVSTSLDKPNVAVPKLMLSPKRQSPPNWGPQYCNYQALQRYVVQVIAIQTDQMFVRYSLR